MAEQEVTMESLVIQDLSGQIAQQSVDRSAWAARARIAEGQVEQLSTRVAELEKELAVDEEKEDK